MSLPYPTDDGKACLEYERPSSIFGQFANARINAFAAELDHKVGTVVATVTK